MDAKTRTKAMRIALNEALEMFGHEFCYRDGRIVVIGKDISAGGMWVMSARIALGLDPITGEPVRKRRTTVKEDA